MIIDFKCHVCRTQVEHKFAQCLSSKCQCKCVEQIYNMSSNQNEDDITVEHPLFLEVPLSKVVKLPNRHWAINNFARVDKTKWTKTKKDKRRKSSRSADYWGDKI